MSDDDGASPGPYGRDGETVGVADSEGEGSITFGSSEEYDKPYHDKEWLFYQYHILKNSANDIAEMVGVVPTTIRNWLHKHDIPTRPLGEAARLAAHGSSRPWEDEDWLREQYIEQHKSIYEIGDEQGVDHMTIHRALVDAGIPRRDGGQHRHNLYPKLQDHDWLRHQYAVRERSMKDIASEIGAATETVRRELHESDIHVRDRSEANTLRWREQQAVPTTDVPKPPSTPNPESEGVGEDEHPAAESTVGKRSYSGPDTGVDLSWNDSSPGESDQEKWVPYWSEEWLRWQYHELGKTSREIASYCGVDKKAILRNMRRFGIERRESGRRPEDD